MIRSTSSLRVKRSTEEDRGCYRRGSSEKCARAVSVCRAATLCPPWAEVMSGTLVLLGQQGPGGHVTGVPCPPSALSACLLMSSCVSLFTMRIKMLPNTGNAEEFYTLTVMFVYFFSLTGPRVEGLVSLECDHPCG